MEVPPTLLYEKDGHVATITLNRPESLNSLTPDMLTGLEAIFADLNADPEAWVAVLTGAGDRAPSLARGEPRETSAR